MRFPALLGLRWRGGDWWQDRRAGCIEPSGASVRTQSALFGGEARRCGMDCTHACWLNCLKRPGQRRIEIHACHHDHYPAYIRRPSDQPWLDTTSPYQPRDIGTNALASSPTSPPPPKQRQRNLEPPAPRQPLPRLRLGSRRTTREDRGTPAAAPQ